jgi:three-Cys-motif partner protein
LCRLRDVATPKDTVWPRDGHTGAKHDLLRRYLQAWVPILLRWNARVTYAEGFSGPGVYEAGEPGSPIIALQTFCQYPDALVGREAHIVLVEERQDRADRLTAELAAATQQLVTVPAALRIHPVVAGDCADVLADALNSCDAPGKPMFVVLDSYGGPDIPFTLLQLVARNKSSEVLLTFQPQFLTRHGQRDAHKTKGDAAFGATHWQGVFDQPSDRKLDYLVDAYKQTLRLAGFDHSLAFEMQDEGGHELWLLFATSSIKGIEKMKEAMWAVDPVHGVRYRDPRDPDQMLLEIETTPYAVPLERILLARLANGGQTLDELRDWANLETVYKKGQVLGAVRTLISSGRIVKPHGRLEGATSLALCPATVAPAEVLTLF